MNKKVIGLILAGILSVGAVGCNSNNTTIQEQQIKQEQNINIDTAYNLAKQIIGNKYDSRIGCSLIKHNDKLEFKLVGEHYIFMNLNDNEQLKEDIINDYQEIIRIYEENNINVNFEINILAYPSKIKCFSIKDGNVYDILDGEFVGNRSNWE